MNSYVKSTISFLAGGIVGAGVAIIFLKRKYALMYRESAARMEDLYSELIKEQVEINLEGGEDQEALAKFNREKPDLNEYAKNIAKEHKFVDYAKSSTIKTVEEVKREHEETAAAEEKVQKPDYYVISPNEFGEFDDYYNIFLTYYADGILADGEDIIDEDDIDNSIGLDFEEHFGEYEDDSVHIRNDRLKCDYEILSDARTFDQAIRDKRLE